MKAKIFKYNMEVKSFKFMNLHRVVCLKGAKTILKDDMRVMRVMIFLWEAQLLQLGRDPNESRDLSSSSSDSEDSN